MISLLNPWALLGIVAVTGFVAWQSYDFGYDRSEAKHAVAAVEQQKRARAMEMRAAGITAASSRNAEIHQQQIQIGTAALINEVSRVVTPKIDLTFRVPWTVVRLHDAAIFRTPLSAIPLPAGQSDDAASPVKASDLARTNVENIGACHGNAQQLTDLQDWIRQQQAAWATQ